MAAEAPKFKIIDNPSVAESYANKLVAASFDGGAVVITLGTARVMPEHTAEATTSLPSVHVTARIAVSPAGAAELANALNNMLKMLSQIKETADAGGKTKPSASTASGNPSGPSKKRDS